MEGPGAPFPANIETGQPYYTYEPYALLVTKYRPDLVQYVQRRVYEIFSHRSEAVSHFTEHFPGVRMSPVLASLFLLNAVDEEKYFAARPRTSSPSAPAALDGRVVPPTRSRASRCPRPEDRRADADMGGAAGDRGLEVVAHAHRQAGEAVAAGEVAQQLEMGDRVGVGGRDRHQAEDRQVVAAAGGEEAVERRRDRRRPSAARGRC